MNEIPIRNIYHMLSYAYESLQIDENILVDVDNFKDLPNLLARVLLNAINSLIKRGFFRKYNDISEDTLHIRGKININQSFKSENIITKKLNCEFSEFEENILLNQIIKTTIVNLIKKVDLEIARKLKKLLIYFNVSTITLKRQVFNRLMWNKSNNHYKLPIQVCELIYNLELPEEGIGDNYFKDFVKDPNKLPHLFEKFVLNFYKQELSDVKVYSPYINWNLTSENNNVYNLPTMMTDIVLETSNRQLIIDTKFYQSIVKNNSYHSSNVYQVYSYMNNSSFEGNISGMLLYASLGEELNEHFEIDKKDFYICTLNLDDKWENIEDRLHEIIKYLYKRDINV
ncbi:5-methylcytosine restriction system specificity protein McrC [Methanosphaera sp.]